MSRKIVVIIVLVVLISVLMIKSMHADELQQVLVSATPASVVLPSPLPLLTQAASTSTATRTPTAPGPALLQALNEANVRAEPDPNSERLGTIRPGDSYPVIGKYFRWYQFQYDQSPSGTGWVFEDLVEIIGDESVIIDLNEQAIPTTDNTAAASTSTMEAITQTPGGILTATANALIIALPVEGVQGEEIVSPVGSQDSSAVLPTFTYPPEIALSPPENAYHSGENVDATVTVTPENGAILVSDYLPPIVPILLLMSFGILGLVITSRR